MAGMLVVQACTFDNEERYVPQTQVSTLLVGAVTSPYKHLIRVEDDRLNPRWEESIGIDSTSLGDLVPENETECWVSVPDRNQVLRVDVVTAAVEPISVPGIQPHYMSRGDRYVMLCDTLQPALGFLHKRNQTLVIVPLATPPGRPSYRSRYFYVPLGDTLSIYQEDALAERGRLALGHPIVWLAQKILVANSLEVLTRRPDGVYERYEVDYNSQQLNSIEDWPLATNYRKVYYTPYPKQYFASQAPQRFFRLPERGEIEDLYPDFLMGEVYQILAGQLVRLPGRQGLVDTLGTARAPIGEAFFLRN